MAIPITIPRLGWTMEEGVFLGWHKGDGDTVRAGEPLFTLEGEKATEEVESLDSGVLRIAADGPRKGDTVRVGAVIGYLMAEDTAEKPPTPTPPHERGGGRPAQAGKPSTQRTPSPRPAISPRARRAAKVRGIDWTTLQGSGRSGRIRERDVLAAADRSEPNFVAVTPMRRLIADRMSASCRTTAPVTLTTTADASKLVRVRGALKPAREIAPAYTDMLVKLTAIALQKHPLLAARWDGARIVLPDAIHIGIAVDTAAGLVVPVVFDVPALNLTQLAVHARDLIERARLGRLAARELQGGVFTVTNLGPFGIDAFTPIINLPECAILGVGRIRRVPMVVGDQIVPREQMTLSLTFDHRIVDGAPAARFLQDLVALIENPLPLRDSAGKEHSP